MSVPIDLIDGLRRGPVEISNGELFGLFELDPEDLRDGIELMRVLTSNGLLLSPDQLALDGVYSLSSPLLESIDNYDPLADLFSDEEEDKEFKQTLHYDVNRSKFDPDASLEQLKNPKVLFSSMKTICAFMNTDGGTLWIGVDDEGRPTDGLLQDCTLFGRTEFDRDFYENHLRSLVADLFDHGRLVNDLLRMTFHELQEGTVLQIRISRSRRLVTLASLCDESHRVAFRRQGNRTAALTLSEVQDFLDRRRS